VQKRIGEFLLEKGVITEQQLRDIVKYSQKTGMRMGDAGMAMGIISRERLIEIFGPNHQIDFFHLDTAYFPTTTRELISTEEMIQWGALPLGFKTEYRMFRGRKILNIGLLDPGRADAIVGIETTARQKLGSHAVHGLKVFLILPDQFVRILEAIYQIPRQQLSDRHSSRLDATLSRYLQRSQETSPLTSRG